MIVALNYNLIKLIYKNLKAIHKEVMVREEGD
jgi:hypothetical protein